MEDIKEFLNNRERDNQRLQRAKEQGFDIETIWYHVSNIDFKEIDLNKSNGVFWLTKDYDSIVNGTTGASLNNSKLYIHKFFLQESKLAGWNEEDNFFQDQLIQKGYDGVLLDNDLKLFNISKLKRIEDEFLLENKQEIYNSQTIFYHGNQNKTHRFSEYRPCFFTTDKNYAEGYGEFVYPYNLEIKKQFNPAIDEKARKYYNEEFLKDELGQEAKKLEKGEHIHFNDADNFWSFIASEAEINNLDYDSIVVEEFKGDSDNYTTNLSIVPLNVKQIKPIQNTKIKNKKG